MADVTPEMVAAGWNVLEPERRARLRGLLGPGRGLVEIYLAMHAARPVTIRWSEVLVERVGPPLALTDEQAEHLRRTVEQEMAKLLLGGIGAVPR